MESVPKAAGMEGHAKSQFRLRVFAADGGHDPRPCCLVNDVCHGLFGFSLAIASMSVESTPLQVFSLKACRAGLMYPEIPRARLSALVISARLKVQDRCQREPVGMCRPILVDHASRNVVQFLWLQEAIPVPRDQGERATKCV